MTSSGSTPPTPCSLPRRRRLIYCCRTPPAATRALPPLPPAGREATLVNLGHTLRKQGLYAEAVESYQRALGLRPGQPGTYSALGYTYHLQGDFDGAIEQYHKVCAVVVVQA